MTRRTTMTWIVTALVLAATAAVHGEEVKLWPDGAPGAKDTGKGNTPTMKAFPLPKGVKGPAPAVLIVPGQDYRQITGYGALWKFFAARPVRVFVLRYRRPGRGYRHPVPLQDARRAVATLRANAARWSIDPKRVLVVGVSSGGHIAAMLATHGAPGKPDAADRVDRFSSRPDYTALFCPVISMKRHAHRPSVSRLLGRKPDPKLVDELSAELHVTAKTPPTFLAHAKDDKMVAHENSVMFHEALKTAGVAATLRLYPKGGHEIISKPRPWKAHLAEWLGVSGVLPAGSPSVTTPAVGYEPTSNYTVKTLEGWSVYVNNALLGKGKYAETGAAAIKNLTAAMVRVSGWIPPEQLAKLRKVKIWLEVDSTNGPHRRTSAYQYHPGRGWLVAMDFNPEKVKCVEFGNAASLARRAPDPTATVLLHELAHAFHDQILDFNHPEVMAAYKRCVNGTTYPKRDWVKSNHKEFFAGVTTRYFGAKTERDALPQRDPVLAKFLLKTWGKPLATMDTPPVE